MLKIGGEALDLNSIRREMSSGVIEMPPGEHSVMAATLISVGLVGFGQLYNRQAGKGALFIVASIALVVASIFKFFSDWQTALGLFVIGAPILIILAASDAYHIARKLNAGEAVGKWQWL